MVALQSADSLRRRYPLASPRRRGGSRPAPPRQSCQAPQSKSPGGSMFPWAISSTRDKVEPATSGTESPAAGADGVAEAAGGGREAASTAAVLAPGEAPSPVLPGAAPSCGPGEWEASGEDSETPDPPFPLGSMFWRRTADRSDNEFTASLPSSKRCRFRGPRSLGGLRVGAPGWAARRTPGPTG